MRTLGLVCTALALAGCAAGAGPTPDSAAVRASAPARGVDLRVCGAVPETPDRTLTEREREARLHLGLGAGYLREGAHEIALRELRASLALDNGVAETHGVMGLLLNALGKYPEARAAYNKALSLAPSNPDIHNNYGVFLCSQGELAAADEHFRCALANPLYSTPEVAYLNAADCAQRAGKSEQAQQDLDAALMIAPDFQSARLRLAEVLYAKGDAVAALRHYRRYADRTAPSAATLALGVRIARAAGDQDRAASYALVLRDRFPDSEEAAALEME